MTVKHHIKRANTRFGIIRQGILVAKYTLVAFKRLGFDKEAIQPF